MNSKVQMLCCCNPPQCAEKHGIVPPTPSEVKGPPVEHRGLAINHLLQSCASIL